MKIYASLAALFVVGQTAAYATSCNVYPEPVGQSVVDTPSGLKILSTAEASVPLDDSDVLQDARLEAKLEAKAAIASFINETVAKACDLNKQSDSVINISAEGKSVDYQKTKTILCGLSESTSMLLRGVVELGSCYTPGKFVRVTVGVKPETVQQALALDQQINSEANEVLTNTNYDSPQSGATRELNSVPGYSDGSRINNF